MIMEINVNNETALIHYLDSNTTTRLNLRTQMQAPNDMHGAKHTKNHAYLIYSQSHYNAVWYNTNSKTEGKNKIKIKRKRKQTNKKIQKLKTMQHKKEKEKYEEINARERKQNQLVKSNIKNRNQISNIIKWQIWNNKIIKSKSNKQKIKKEKNLERN